MNDDGGDQAPAEQAQPPAAVIEAAWKPPVPEPKPPVPEPKPVGTRAKLVAAFLAMGGLIGVVGSIWQQSEFAGGVLSVQVPLPWMLPFILATAAGILLLRGKRAGVVLSAIVLALQLFAVRYDNFEYAFSTGAGVYLGAVTPQEGGLGFGFFVSWGSRFALFWGAHPGGGRFVINVVAAIGLILLWPTVVRRPNLWSELFEPTPLPERRF
jgi:hypothetical protein